MILNGEVNGKKVEQKIVELMNSEREYSDPSELFTLKTQKPRCSCGGFPFQRHREVMATSIFPRFFFRPWARFAFLFSGACYMHLPMEYFTVGLQHTHSLTHWVYGVELFDISTWPLYVQCFNNFIMRHGNIRCVNRLAHCILPALTPVGLYCCCICEIIHHSHLKN